MLPEHGKKVLRMLNVFQSVSPTAQVLLAVTLLWLVLMAVGGVFAKQRAGEVAEEVR